MGRLAGDSALYGMAAALAKALALLTVPFLTRALNPVGYGEAELATSTAALVTLVGLISGDIPAAREHGRAESPTGKRGVLASYVWSVGAACLVLTFVLLAAAPWIASEAWGEARLTPLLALALVLVPISGLQAALVQVQRLRNRPRSFAALAAADLLAQLGLAVLLVAIGLGPFGVVLGFIVGSLVGLGAAAAAARDVVFTRPTLRASRQIVRSGLLLVPYAAAFVAADWAARSIVGNQLGTAAVAELAVAIRVASVISLFSAAFALAWGPVGLAMPSGTIETSRRLRRTLGYYGIGALAFALIVAALGPELVGLFAGDAYLNAVQILPALAIASAVAGGEYVLVVAAGIGNRESRVGIATACGAAVQVAMLAVLLAPIGLAAVGIGVLAGRLVSFLALLVSMRREVSTDWRSVLAVGVIGASIGLLLQLTLTSEGHLVAIRFAVAAAIVVASLVAIVRASRRHPAA